MATSLPSSGNNKLPSSGKTNLPSGTSLPAAGRTNLPASAAPTSPANLTALVAWYDGFDINLLANAGIADNDPIGTWKNKGTLGASIDVVQATGGSKPLFKLSRINAHPAVLFDAVDDSLLSASASPLAADVARHIFIVVEVPAVQTPGVAGLWLPRNGQGYCITAGADSTRIETNNNGGGVDTTNVLGAAPTAGNRIIEVSFDGVTTNKPIVKINGVLQTVTNSSGTGVGNEVAVPNLYFGHKCGAAIGDALCYDGVQSAGNAADTYAYLAAKWGI